MKENEAYSAIGGVFEYLNNDCGYEQWSQYLIDKLRSLNVGSRGVDAGCGNGYFTRAMYRAGYDVVGLDVSERMLSKAVQLARAEGVKAEFLLGDLAKLKLNFKPDFIIAVNDCINYISGDKLPSAFERIFKSLKKGGVFIFDISSERKLKNVLGNNLFAEDRDEMTYLWFNTLKEDRVEMDITLFTRLSDGTYRREDERQTQYIHGEKEILGLLQNAGFEVQTEGHLGGSKDERINFICKKL